MFSMSSEKSKIKENFPVGLVVSPSLKPLVYAYYRAARLADDVADAKNVSNKIKIQKLSEISKAFINHKEPSAYNEVSKLGQIFAKENLDSSLYLDLLEAFKRDVSAKPIRIWEELIDYCRYSAAPVGRFMMAIHNENYSTYIPAQNLCIILQLLDDLGDIKEDLSLLKRCYIPEDMLAKYGVKESDLGLSYTKPEVALMLKEFLSKIKAMHKDVQHLPRLITNFRLRFEVCIILSLTNSMINKYNKVDILQYKPSLGYYDWAKSLAYGLLKSLFLKY